MINYYVLLTIRVPETSFYFEVGFNQELAVPVNLSDEVFFFDYCCKVYRITHQFDCGEVWLRIESDCMFVRNEAMTDEECCKKLNDEWLEMKEWFEENEEKIILTNWNLKGCTINR